MIARIVALAVPSLAVLVGLGLALTIPTFGAVAPALPPPLAMSFEQLVGLAAALLLLPLWWWARTRSGLVLTLTAAAVLAGHAAARAGQLYAITTAQGAAAPEGWATYDLAEGPIPAGARGFARVHGYVRGEWALKEYATPEGERPQQDAEPEAVLVPVVGTDGPEVAVDGAIVVARVPASRRYAAGKQTLEGTLGPIEAQLLNTLITAQTKEGAAVDVAALTGVLLDTSVMPKRGQAPAQLLLALVAWAVALASGWLATAPRPPIAAAAPSAGRKGRARRKP